MKTKFKTKNKLMIPIPKIDSDILVYEYILKNNTCSGISCGSSGLTINKFHCCPFLKETFCFSEAYDENEKTELISKIKKLLIESKKKIMLRNFYE